MPNRGRRYDEPKLNKKKVFAVILAFIVLLMFIFVIKGILEKGAKQGRITSKSYFSVYKDNKWGVIDETGNIVIDPSYAEMIIIPNSKNDIFLCTYDVNYETGEYKTKALNSKNEEIFTYYDRVETIQSVDANGNINYNQELLKVMKNGKYGTINTEGKDMVPCEYDKIEGIAGKTNALKVVKDGKAGIVTSSGEQILEAKYDDITNIYEDNRYVIIQDGAQKLIKNDGTELLTKGFDEIIQILKKEDNGVIYKKGGKYGVMTLLGNVTIEPTYEDLREAKTGILIAKKGGKYGVIDLSNDVKIDFVYNGISYESKADIYITENEQFINEILNNQYEVKQMGMLLEINSEKGYFVLRKDDGNRYYNFQFEEKNEADIFASTNLFLSKKDGKYGFVDKDGKVVVDYKYDDATNQNSYGFAGIKKDGKWGAINSKGEVTQEPTYNLDDYLQIDFIGRWHLGKDLNMNYYTQN